MIASNLNIRDFLSKADTTDFEAFLYSLERELTEAERTLYRHGVSEDVKRAARDYSRKLWNFMFNMRYSTRPPGLTNDEFISLVNMANSFLGKTRFSFKGGFSGLSRNLQSSRMSKVS
jgi:hypothetical protein